MSGRIDASRTVACTVSGPWLRTMWRKCETSYIREVCKGRCCQGAGGRVQVSILRREVYSLENLDTTVRDGFLKPDVRKLCPFKLASGLCRIHVTDSKPFGCRSAPFILNRNGTLVIRHRYIHMPCYNGSVSAYEAFRGALDFIFGKREASAIRNAAIDPAVKKIDARMPVESYSALVELQGIRHR